MILNSKQKAFSLTVCLGCGHFMQRWFKVTNKLLQSENETPGQRSTAFIQILIHINFHCIVLGNLPHGHIFCY